MLPTSHANADPILSPFEKEVAKHFGFVPNFFKTASSAPGLMEELWKFAQSAYIYSPLPSLFKERLLVYLSRYCPVRYCIIRHVGFLTGRGHPAGDVTAQPQRVPEVMALLQLLAPDSVVLNDVYQRMENSKAGQLPEPGTAGEADLFTALAIVFIEPRRSEKARKAIIKGIGEPLFEMLTAYLAFVRMLHYWTETHPDLTIDEDLQRMLEEETELAKLLLSTKEAERIQAGEFLRKTLLESEEKYYGIFQSIDEGFCILEVLFDNEGQPEDCLFVEANKAFEKHTGLAQVEGKRMREVVPEPGQLWLNKYGEVATTGKPQRFQSESKALQKYYDVYTFSVGDPANRRVAVLFSDISERVRLEKQKDDFISIASHELKTPVANMQAYTYLLQSHLTELGDTVSVGMVQHLESQAKKLTRLIQDLLDTSQIAEGQMKLQYETFDLNELVQEKVEQFRVMPATHALSVCQTADLVIRADKERLDQVLSNLISNAIKYSPAGSPIQITTAQEEGSVVVSVRDSGIGISEAAKGKLFGRFFRAKNAQEDGFPGLGLGLYISAIIVRQHGGTIRVDSHLGEGSEFVFTIPVGGKM